MIFLDFETRSRFDLGAGGGHRYAADPSTEPLLLVALSQGYPGYPATVWIWCPFAELDLDPLPYGWDALTRGARVVVETGPAPAALFAALPGHSLVAHNAFGFDQLLWERLGWPNAEWFDSANLARRRALPGKLEGACRVALELTEAKDKHGARVLARYMQPDKTGAMKQPNPDALLEIARYCLKDVVLLADLWRAESIHGDLEPAQGVECGVESMDYAVNRRGACVDLDYAEKLAAVSRALTARVVAAGQAATGHADIASRVRSVPQLLKMLGDLGVPAGRRENAQKDTLKKLRGFSPAVDAVLDTRSAVSGVLGGKIAAFKHFRGSDGRARGMFAYHSAHTGRWGGRGPQPQNLTKMDEEMPASAVENPAELLEDDDNHRAARRLGGLVRGCIAAEPGNVLVIADLSQIEARGLRWMAGDDQGLEPFRRSEDLYVAVAARMFSVGKGEVTKEQRQAGKVAELACGYQGGAGALGRFAEKVGAKLGDRTPSDLVEAWRDANSLIAGRRTGGIFETEHGKVFQRKGGLWKRVGNAVRRVLSGEEDEVVVGECTWFREPTGTGHLVCQLPSGRWILYRHAAVEERPSRWDPSRTVQQIMYTDPRRGRTATYGGKLVENLCQAICRDILAQDVLLPLHMTGAPIVLHVHDEAVLEVPEREAATTKRMLEDLMSKPPSWAPSMPIACKVHVARRYGK